MPAPNEEEVLAYFQTLSNRGRWGAGDQLGTLNLVTPANRVAAAALVRDGVTVSCAWNIESAPEPDPTYQRPERVMLRTGEALGDEAARLVFAREHLGLVFHGFAVTHLDSLCHTFWEGSMYNGVPAARVTAAEGATTLDVTALRDGVVTRGVLLDMAALKGKPWLDPDQGVFVDDLEAAESRAGVTVGEGDVLLIRTGNGRRRRAPEDERGSLTGYASCDATCLGWLHDRGVAMLGSDTGNNVSPTQSRSIENPIHAVGMVAMGLWILDNCNLEELAATCERLERWEFQFTVAPLRWAGATGSPVNPLALF